MVSRWLTSTFVLLCSSVGMAAWLPRWLDTQPSNADSNRESSVYTWYTSENIALLPRELNRTEFHRGSAVVQGFPSTGGILVQKFDAVLAMYLGLPKMTPVNPASDKDEEDAFCLRLRSMGAKWWPDRKTQVLKELDWSGYERTPEERQQVVVGYPATGGLWVLRCPEEAPPTAGFYLLSFCADMEERCELLKHWNATFYEDPAEVPELQDWRNTTAEDLECSKTCSDSTLEPPMSTSQTTGDQVNLAQHGPRP